jgi:hypothetical protein
MAEHDSHDDWREANPPLAGYCDGETVATDLAPQIVADPDWSDHENSDPFADVAAGIAAYRAHHDRPPAKLVISPRLRDALLGHPLVLERLRFVEPGTQITPALLDQLFDVADVIIV